MKSTTNIGSGRPKFILPNNRFDQITRQPLALICRVEAPKETQNVKRSTGR